MATHRRQVRMLLTFMVLFAVMFFLFLLYEKLDVPTKLVGCGLSGALFTMLAHSYYEIVNK